MGHISARRSMRLVDYFMRALDRGPDRIAFMDETRSVTYGEADLISSRIAAGLQSLELGDAPKVAVLSPNRAKAFEVVLGIVRSGAIWVPANMRNAPQVNAGFLKTADCNCLFYDSSLANDVAKILEMSPNIKVAICIDGEPLSGGMTLDELIDRTTSRPEEPSDDPDTLVMILPTGGTTGQPKAVMITNQVWSSVVATAWECMRPHDRVAFLVAGPMTHGAGIVALMMLAAGPEFVVLRKPDPQGVMQAIDEKKITHLFVPPTMLNMIMEHPSLDEFDFSSLEHMVISASPIAPEKLRKAISIFGDAICESFGQAEAPMFLTFLSNADLREAETGDNARRYGSCGRATLGVRVEIMGEDGKILPIGQRGEIVARGSIVFPGYYRNPQATEDTFAFGWHHTGDVGYKDEQGFVYIVDRKKDMIVTGGFNVFSAEVEAVIVSHPAVRECVVIGVPDDKWGEAIKAVIELVEGGAVSPSEIQAIVRDALGGVHTPKSVDIWPELPRSTNGKILKSEVRAHFWQGRERAVG